MNRLYISIGALAIAFTACQSPKENTDEAATEKTASLTRKWETDTVLTTCESVLYDKQRDVLYVSNIKGAPDQKDGNGSIAKVSLDGNVVAADWAKGMDAPKGMGLVNNTLYVTDIDRVHEVDVESGSITKTHTVEGAQFLNDIATGEDGRVFISDMAAGRIHVIENGQLSTWMENVDGPNGLDVANGKLMMVSWNSKTFNSIDLSSKEVAVKADSIENGDGVEPVGDGAYLVSSWNGMVHLVDDDGGVKTLLDTRADSVNAADIEFIQDKNLLLVPGFFKNKVVAYELTRE